MKWVRVLEYDGPDEWVRKTVQFSRTRPVGTFGLGQVREVYSGQVLSMTVDLAKPVSHEEAVT